MPNSALFWIGMEVVSFDSIHFSTCHDYQVTDHPSTLHDSVHNLMVTAHIADTMITTKIPVQVNRNATKAERQLSTRAFLDFNLTQVDTPVTIYEKGWDQIKLLFLSQQV